MVRSSVDSAVSGVDAVASGIAVPVSYPVFDYSDLLDLPQPATSAAEDAQVRRPVRGDWLRSMQYWMRAGRGESL